MKKTSQPNPEDTYIKNGYDKTTKPQETIRKLG